MRKSRFTEEQIIGILKEHDAGAKAEELCRRHGISGTTFHKWKAKFGGLEVSEARRLRALEDENRRLKKLLAEQMLDNAALKDLVGKNFRRLGRVMRQFTTLLSVTDCRSDALRGCSGSTGRRCVTARSARMTLRNANCCGRWRPNGAGSATGGCGRWPNARDGT